jgi:hypothetical protein
MESALPQAWPRPPYVPLVVGVTGHRNILASARPEIWVRVRDVLLELLADRGRRRLIVMSGLAEGADRLVASVAFDLKEQARYRDVIDVVACLPLTPDEYERDFETEASKASFREMLGRCVHSIVVSDETGVTDRPECYRLQGRLLTRYAQVLVALWDGDEGRGRGGTAEVVQMMLGRPPADMYAPLADPIGAGRVTQIVTPRDDRPRPERAFERVDSWIAEGPESDAVRATRQEAARECFETIDASVLRLNERIAVEHAAGDVRARVSKTYLLGEGDEATWTPLDHLVRAYAYADGLAIPDKARWERAHFRLMTLVAAFLSMFVVYSDFLGYPVFLMAHALLAATALGYWGTVKDQKRSHLDMRALAEGLRVQIVWSLAGVRAWTGSAPRSAPTSSSPAGHARPRRRRTRCCRTPASSLSSGSDRRRTSTRTGSSARPPRSGRPSRSCGPSAGRRSS